MSEAFARVVQKGAFSGGIFGLSAELRSDVIPAVLRPAAIRLADLLRVPQPTVSAPAPVPLETFSADRAHAGHVGVCPVSGLSAPVGELFETFDPAHEVHGKAPGAQNASPAPTPTVEASLEAQADAMFTAFVQPELRVQAELPFETPEVVSHELISKAENELVREENAREAPGAQIPTKGKRTTAQERAKKAATSGKPAAKAAGSQKVAASTPADKTSARPSAKPLAKRPSAKAGRKKD